MDKRDREILQFTVDAGILLLANGAETFRAQQTMVYIAKNLGAEGFEAYVLTNGIIASLKGDSAHAQVRHSPRNGMHMGRVEAINEMSREIANGVLDLDGAKVRLEQVRAMPDMTVRDQVLACAAGSVCFGYIFGGNVLECLIAGAVGGMVQYAMVMLARTGMNRIFARLASAAMLVCAVSLVQVICPWLDVETTAIGALMPLTPGVAVTMGIRDYVSGDYLAGTIRLIDALFAAGSVAIGVGAALGLVNLLGGGLVLWN